MLADFGTGQVFLSMLYFFLFFIWIWLLITIFADVFRSPELSGWSKALWCLFVIVLPFLGVLVYLIARGGRMHEHAMDAAHAQEEQFRSYVRSEMATASPSNGDQLSMLSSLRAQGAIDDEEYERLKSRVSS